jgi:hypothetical protein
MLNFTLVYLPYTAVAVLLVAVHKIPQQLAVTGEASVEKPAENHTAYPEDMSSNPLRGHKLGAVGYNIDALWGTVFYNKFKVSVIKLKLHNYST